MDINFKCPHCGQDLSADDTGSGAEIQCPACNQSLVIPAATAAPPPGGGGPVNPIMASAAAREHKHFAVPQHDKKGESLIAKPAKPLEAAAREGPGNIRIKCIRHYDCVEVGKDHFDEVVTKFLNQVGEGNIVKMETFNYSHRDLETRDWVTDYGILIIYHG